MINTKNSNTHTHTNENTLRKTCVFMNKSRPKIHLLSTSSWRPWPRPWWSLRRSCCVRRRWWMERTMRRSWGVGPGWPVGHHCWGKRWDFWEENRFRWRIYGMWRFREGFGHEFGSWDDVGPCNMEISGDVWCMHHRLGRTYEKIGFKIEDLESKSQKVGYHQTKGFEGLWPCIMYILGTTWRWYNCYNPEMKSNDEITKRTWPCSCPRKDIKETIKYWKYLRLC